MRIAVQRHSPGAFQATRSNVGTIEDPDGKSTEGSPACGDMVSVYLKVDREDQGHRRRQVRVLRMRLATSPPARSSPSWPRARPSTEAKKITWKEASDELGGLPAIKAHCSVLAVEGLRAAIRDYEEKNGLVVEQVPTTEAVDQAPSDARDEPAHGPGHRAHRPGHGGRG